LRSELLLLLLLPPACDVPAINATPAMPQDVKAEN